MAYSALAKEPPQRHRVLLRIRRLTNLETGVPVDRMLGAKAFSVLVAGDELLDRLLRDLTKLQG